METDIDRIVVFGAGDEGVKFFLKNRNCNIIAFADNNESLCGMQIYDVPIVSPDKLREIKFDKLYISPYMHYKEILFQLETMGIEKEKIFMDIIQEKSKELRGKVFDNLHLFIEAYTKDAYERKWRLIKRKYSSIRVYRLYVDAIGELIPRFSFIVQDITNRVKRNTLNVFLPDTAGWTRICNKDLLELVRENIYLPIGEELSFWDYVYRNHLRELDLSMFDKYASRNAFPTYQVGLYKNDCAFIDKKMEFVQAQINQMNLHGEFVCMVARSPEYNMKTIGTDYEYDYMNMSFDDYRESIKLLKQKNITAVRMGRQLNPLSFSLDNCIDYAGLWANDFMDLWLAGHCKFMLVNSTGVMTLPSLFGVPLCYVNAVNLSFGRGGFQYTSKDIYIPKKYYDTRKKRYLSLLEISQIEKKCWIWGERYKNQGVRIENNTSGEIRMAVDEMLQRLDNRWEDTKEDAVNYKRYLEIYDEMLKSSYDSQENWTGGPIPYRISAMYLRVNAYLLE